MVEGQEEPDAPQQQEPDTPQQEEPDTPKRKLHLAAPLSIVLILIIVLSVTASVLIVAELIVRDKATQRIAATTACVTKDKATAKFGVAPLVLWQLATKHFTNISVETAGNQIRDAKGMKILLKVQNVQLKDGPDSKGTIGSLDATITWTSEGIKQSVQNAIPVLGPFVTDSVQTHPDDGTIQLTGALDEIVATPTVSNGGIELKITSFSTLGFTMPKESVQSTLDNFTSNLTKGYPLGIHADSVQVTSSGVEAHFSTHNANIPANNSTDPCFTNL